MSITSERSEVTEHAPNMPGHGSSRRWTRTIAGKLYSFNAVLMPNGERRYFARVLKGNDARFDCNWKPAGGWIIPAPKNFGKRDACVREAMGRRHHGKRGY